eukprot:SM000026S08927  [mRNA]  locus=s26:505146:507853:- [translate_table: standard]
MQEARLAQLEQSVPLAAFGNRGPLINVEATANNVRKLGLRFEIRLHKWKQPVSSPWQSYTRALLPTSAVTIFPTSVSLRLPPARLSANFTLRGLASLEVVVVSPVLMATEVLMKVNGESIAQGLQPSWPDAPGKAPLKFSFARLWEYSCGTIGIDTSSPCMTGEREAEGENTCEGRNWTDNSMEDDLWASSSYQKMGQTGALLGSIVLGTLPEKDAASKTLSEQVTGWDFEKMLQECLLSWTQPVRIHLGEAPIVPCAMLHTFSVKQAPIKRQEEGMQPAWCYVEDPVAHVSVTVEFSALEADFSEFLTQMQPVTHLKQLQC